MGALHLRLRPRGTGPLREDEGRRSRIVYDGPSKDPDYILARKRALKYSTLEKAGRLPTVEEVEDAAAFLSHYSLPFFAHASEEEIEADRASRGGWVAEDEDPWRDAHHAVLDPKPYRAQYGFGACRRCDWSPIEVHRGCTIDGNAQFADDLALWEARQIDVGYAGPTGFLGLDDDGDDEFRQ